MSLKLTKKGTMTLRENIDGYFKAKVTKFGSGAKIGCGKDFVDREVVVFVLKEGGRA